MEKIEPVRGNYYISQGWNEWNPRFYGSSWGFRHKGIDYATYGATPPVVAIQDGVVTFAGWKGTQRKGFGQVVIIDHGGYESWSAHLSYIGVSVGQTVAQGDEIGNVGSTGMSTGEHLHLGVKEGGTWKNPDNYLELKPKEEEDMDDTLWMNTDVGEIYRVWNPTATYLRWNAGNSSDAERYLLSRQIPGNHWVKKSKIQEITNGKREVKRLAEMS